MGLVKWVYASYARPKWPLLTGVYMAWLIERSSIMWICSASGRSLVASAMRWNSLGCGVSLIDRPSPSAFR